jgi:hypothetical protein
MKSPVVVAARTSIETTSTSIIEAEFNGCAPLTRPRDAAFA